MYSAFVDRTQTSVQILYITMLHGLFYIFFLTVSKKAAIKVEPKQGVKKT
jgi:hypothetical protein